MLFKRIYAKIEELRRSLAATDFDNELQDDRIAKLEGDIADMRKEIAELKGRTMVPSGDLLIYSELIPVSRVVRLLLDHLGLRLDRVPAQDSKVVLKKDQFFG